MATDPSSTSVGTTFTATIENKMLRDKRMISATGDLSYLVAAQLQSGPQNFFGAAPDPSKCLVYRFYPDTQSQTGWSRQDIRLPGHFFLAITCGVGSDGAPRLFVMTADVDTPTGATPATVYEVPLAADGTPGMPVKLASTQTSPLPQLMFSPVGPSLFWPEVTVDCHLAGVYGPKLNAPFVPHNEHDFQVLLGLYSLCPVSSPLPPAAWPNVSVIFKDPLSNLQMMHGLQMDPGPVKNLQAEWSVIPSIQDASGKDMPVRGSSAAVFQDGRYLLLATVGDGQLRAIEGTPDATGKVVWSASWTALDLSGGKVTSDDDVRVLPRKDGGVTVAWIDQSRKVWMSGRGPGASDGWEDAVPVNTYVVHATAAFLDDQGDFALTACCDDGYIRRLIKDAKEDWSMELVDTEDGTTFEDVDVYRVGVVVQDDGGGAVIGKSVTVAPDDETQVMVNGLPYYVSADEPLTLTTDQNGCVWLMVDIYDSLAVPTFSFTSTDGIFDGKTVVVMPESDAQKFTTTDATAQSLQSAVDADGKPLLSPQTPFPEMAAQLNKLGAAIAHIYQPCEFRSPRLFVPARAGVRVVGSLDEVNTTPLPLGSWAATRRNGVIVFETLTAEEASLRVSAEVTRVATSRGLAANADPNGFFDDWEDAFESIADGIASVANIIVDGIQATVTFVVDGISRIVQAALDALSPLLDVVTAVFDLAGAIFGRVVGWVLRAIGWLFGWPDMIAIKNRIKQCMVDQVGALNKALSDPTACVQRVQGKIADFESNLQTYINQFRSTQAGSQSNQTSFGSVPSFAGSLMSGSNPISSQITWIVEKFFAILPRFDGGAPAFPDVGVGKAVTDFQAQIVDMAANVDAFCPDLLAAGLSSWVGSLTSFDGANIDPVLDAFQKHASGLLEDMSGMVGDAGTIAHALWANPSAVTNWLDTSIHIPFFSSFYEGVVGNEFSVLDFIALAAALPYSIIGPSDSNRRGQLADDREALVYTIYSLMLVRCLIAGFEAFKQEPGKAPSPNGGQLGLDVDDLLSRLHAALNVGIASAVLGFSVTYDEKHWYAPAMIDLFAALTSLVTFFFSPTDKKKWGAIVENGLGIAAALLGGIFSTAALGFDLKTLGYAVLAGTSDAASLLVDRRVVPVEGLPQRAAYALLQGGLAFLGAELFREGALNAAAKTPADQAIPHALREQPGTGPMHV